MCVFVLFVYFRGCLNIEESGGEAGAKDCCTLLCLGESKLILGKVVEVGVGGLCAREKRK